MLFYRIGRHPAKVYQMFRAHGLQQRFALVCKLQLHNGRLGVLRRGDARLNVLLRLGQANVKGLGFAVHLCNFPGLRFGGVFDQLGIASQFVHGGLDALAVCAVFQHHIVAAGQFADEPVLRVIRPDGAQVVGVVAVIHLFALVLHRELVRVVIQLRAVQVRGNAVAPHLQRAAAAH